MRVLDYDHDKQAWENADVNDYTTTQGQLKDRRWEEGPTVLKTRLDGRTRYYLTYSANNSAGPQYAVGYAVSDSPLGPFHKAPTNPILQSNPALGEYSTGHGGIVASPDGSQLYYVHHGRPTPTDPQRRLHTDEMHFSLTNLDPWGSDAVDRREHDRPAGSLGRRALPDSSKCPGHAWRRRRLGHGDGRRTGTDGPHARLRTGIVEAGLSRRPSGRPGPDGVAARADVVGR